MKKYELTNETIQIEGKKLYRIKALIDFGDVKAGDLGGFIEKESNLSHLGNAWVYDNARVCGNARVCDDAWVYDNARVYGNARVCGNAGVCDDGDYACVKGFGTEYRNTTFYKQKNGSVGVNCGCFTGTLEEFRNQVKKTRKGKIEKEYLMIADLIEYHFAEEETMYKGMELDKPYTLEELGVFENDYFQPTFLKSYNFSIHFLNTPLALSFPLVLFPFLLF